MQRLVARGVAEHHLWEPGTPLVLAVSGGADSLCLLGVLLALRGEGGPAAPGVLTVAHLDHGLRAESADDARFVADLAEREGLPCVVGRADVASLARREHRGIEDAARRARYAFLRRVAAEADAALIATGHTSDDQVETIILHWLRGAGLAGLRGMRWRSTDVVRPLLGVSHAQAVAYCAARGWQPREDLSNRDSRFLRNRVRRELLPALRTYNPGIDALLLRNAGLLAADDDALEARADAVWGQAARVTAVDGEPVGVAFPLETLREVPAAVRYRLYRRAAALLGGESAALEARHLTHLERLVLGRASGRAAHLPGDLRAHREYGTLAFAREAAQDATAAQPHPTESAQTTWTLPVPGVVDLPALGWRVRAWLSDGVAGIPDAQTPPAPALPPFARVGSAADLGVAEARVSLDADVAGDQLLVRTWRPGDRFRPFGMGHEKKVQDYFTDAKVPRALRRRLPLVFGRDHLLWIGGQRLDDRASVTSATQRVLTLQIEPLPA